MEETEANVRKVIADYEDRKISGDLAIEALNKLTGKDVDIYHLENYWRSEDLDTFIKRLSIPPIDDWKEIDDSRALELIIDIFNSWAGNPEIVDRNCEALEKRYGKPTGSINGKIVGDDITDPNEILEYLKKETRIFL